MLFDIVYRTCNYFGITPKIKTKEMRDFNESVADLVMLELLNRVDYWDCIKK